MYRDRHPARRYTRRATAGTLSLAAFSLAAAACAPQGTTAGGSATPTPSRAHHEVDLRIEERRDAPPGSPPEFYFEPVGLAIKPGQTVRFRAQTPHHDAHYAVLAAELSDGGHVRYAGRRPRLLTAARPPGGAPHGSRSAMAWSLLLLP